MKLCINLFLLLIASTVHAADEKPDSSLTDSVITQNKVTCLAPTLYRDVQTMHMHYSNDITLKTTTFDAVIANGLKTDIAGVVLDLKFKNSFGRVITSHKLEQDIDVLTNESSDLRWTPDLVSVPDYAKITKLHALADSSSTKVDCKVIKIALTTGQVISQK